MKTGGEEEAGDASYGEHGLDIVHKGVVSTMQDRIRLQVTLSHDGKAWHPLGRERRRRW